MIRVLISNPGRPISPRLHPRSSGVVRVFDFKIGAPHQSKAPSSEFRGGIRVLILKSGAPHQSKAPSSEFRGGKSSDFKIRGAPSVQGSILGVQGW